MRGRITSSRIVIMMSGRVSKKGEPMHTPSICWKRSPFRENGVLLLESIRSFFEVRLLSGVVIRCSCLFCLRWCWPFSVVVCLWTAKLHRRKQTWNLARVKEFYVSCERCQNYLVAWIHWGRVNSVALRGIYDRLISCAGGINNWVKRRKTVKAFVYFRCHYWCSYVRLFG